MISGNGEQGLVEPGKASSGGGMARSKSAGIGGKEEMIGGLKEPKAQSVSKKPSGGNYSPSWTSGKG